MKIIDFLFRTVANIFDLLSFIFCVACIVIFLFGPLFLFLNTSNVKWLLAYGAYIIIYGIVTAWDEVC